MNRKHDEWKFSLLANPLVDYSLLQDWKRDLIYTSLAGRSVFKKVKQGSILVNLAVF